MIKKFTEEIVTVDDLIDAVMREKLRCSRNGEPLPAVFILPEKEVTRLRKLMAHEPMERVWSVSDPTRYPEHFTILGVEITPRR